MRNEIVKLVAESTETNEFGDVIRTETEREVFVEVKSISQSEFYQAQASGMKPEIKFVMSDYLDYEGEKLLRYRPYAGVEETYTIIRTYQNGITLELTAKRGVD